MFALHLSLKEQERVISLVGQKCAVNCLMNDKPVTASWDTKAMVSLKNRNFLTNYLGDLKINPNRIGGGGGADATPSVFLNAATKRLKQLN